VWDHSAFSRGRARLLAHRVVEGFFAEVLRLADRQGLLSMEHYPVDGTLNQAWARQKSSDPRTGRTTSGQATAGAMPWPTGRAGREATTPTRAPPIQAPAPAAAMAARSEENFAMTDIRAIEREIERLDDKTFAAFRDWFIAYENARWDRRIEADAAAGKLDPLVEEALAEHRTGKTRPM